MASKSRPQRWAEAVSDAQDAIARLVELQEEYADWHGNLPENMEFSPTAEKLEVVVDLEIEYARQILDDVETADLPLGFGRD